MPENKDYISNVHKALSSEVDGFSVSEPDFRTKMQDENYVKKVHKALSSEVEGFNVSEEDFLYSKVGLKKKGEATSEDSSTPAPSPLQPSKASGEKNNVTQQLALGGAKQIDKQHSDQEIQAHRRADAISKQQGKPTGDLQQDVSALEPKTISQIAPPKDIKKTEDKSFFNKLSDSAKQTFGVVKNAVQQGSSQGDMENAFENLGKNASEDDLKTFANAAKKVESIHTHPIVKKFEEAKGIGEAWDAFTENPMDVALHLMTKSTTSLLKTGVDEVNKNVISGTAIGATGGSVVPGVGTTAGAIAGAGYGLTTGMVEAGFNAEYTSDIIESLKESGIDVTDSDKLRNAFNDDKKMAEFKSHALKRAVPIAVFDAFSGGLAGKLFKQPAKTALRRVAQGVAEMGVQATFDAGGELVSQKVAGDKTNYQAALSEVLGGLPQNVVEVSTGAITSPKDPSLIGRTHGGKPVYEQSVSEELQQKIASSNVKQPNKRVTVESAVIEIGDETFEGKNHAEAILKAQQAGKDISQVDRQGQGMFKLSDGSVISREQAKETFGADKAEMLITQDDNANKANDDYEKVKLEFKREDIATKIASNDTGGIANTPIEDVPLLVKERTNPTEDVLTVTPLQENITLAIPQPTITGAQKQEGAIGVQAVSENVQETGTSDAEGVPVGEKGTKDLNILGTNIGFDKPNRKDYNEGVEGDLEYANANSEHSEKVDKIIGGLTQDGTLKDSEGNEYIITITGQGVRVVNKLQGGLEGDTIYYRKGKRTHFTTPFSKGFTFKPKNKGEQNKITNEPTKEQNVQASVLDQSGTTDSDTEKGARKVISPKDKIQKGLSGLKEKIGLQIKIVPKKRKRTPVKNTRNERIKNQQRDTVTSIARGYFLDGGKVLWQSPDGGITRKGLKEELNYGEGEKRSLVGILSKNGLGVEQIAHQLWENQPISQRYSTSEFRDAIHTVISENRKDWFDFQEKEANTDYFSDEYIEENTEKFESIVQEIDEAAQIIKEQGITKDNIDKLQVLFNGFIYTEQDFENVKKKLYERGNETDDEDTGQASEGGKQRSGREGSQETGKRRGIAESISSKIRSLRESKTEAERKKLEDEIISESGDYILMHEGVIVGNDASFANRKSKTFFDLIDSKKSVYLLDEDARIAQSKSDYLKLADELETTTNNPLFTEEEIESIKNKAEAIRQGAINGIVMFDDVLNSDLNLLKSVARDLGFDGVKVTEIDGTESTVHLWNFEKLTLVGGTDITGKSKMALGISRLMNKLGVEKNLVPDEYTSVFDDILLIAEGLFQETGKAGLGLIVELKKILKKEGYSKLAKDIDSFSDDILDALTEKNTAKSENKGEKVEKTITTKRGFKGTTNEDLQKAYENQGLHRYIKNQKEALDKAGNFLKEVGFDNAMDKLRNATDMRLMNKTMLWGKLMIEANQMLLDAKTETERQEALQRRAEITEWGSEHGLNMGEGASAFNAVYKDFEENGLDFGTDKLVEDAIKLWESENKKDGESVTIPNSLKEEFQALGEKIKAVNKELADANDKLAEKEAHIAILELRDSEQKATNEKTIAAKKQAAKKKVSDGLSEMFGAFASITGGKLSAVDSDEKIIRGARKAIEGFMEEASITFEEAFNKLKEAVKSKGYNTDKLDEIRQNLESESTQSDKKESLFGLGNKKLRKLAMEVEMGKYVTPEQQVKQYVELIKNEISETHEGITDREIRDEISGYGKVITQSKEDGQKELSKMKNLFRGVSQLEDIGNGEPPKKSGFQKDPTDTDVRLIFRRVREALKTLPLDPETKEGLLKTAEQSYLKRLTNRIEDIKKENATKIRVKKEKNQPLNSKDITDAKDIIAELEKEHSEIFRDELENEKTQAKLKASKSALNKRITDLEKKIAANDFSKKEKPKQPFDEEKRKLILKKEKLVENFNVASAKYAREHRTAGKKRVDAAIEITMALQAMKTAFDLGLAGVQLIPLLSRSVLSDIANARLSGDKSRTIKALGNAFKSFASTKYAQKKLDEIRTDPYFDKAKKSQLSLIGVSQEVNEFQNEIIDDFMEKVVEKITRSRKVAEIVNNKSFTRFNTTLGNELRFGTFKKAAIAAEMLGYDIETNKKEFKDIAGTVNSFSGRAKMKWLTENDIARVALFSPKNWASMIKTATPVGLFSFARMKGDKTLPLEGGIVLNSPARREAARTLLAMTTAGVSMTILVAMKYNDDEDDDTWVNLIDPTRSDFMKVSTKLKDGSVVTSDFFGGRLSMIIAQARFIASWRGNEQTSLSGKKRINTPIDVLAEHSGNKLSPLFGTTKAYLSDRYRSVKGEKEKVKTDQYTKKPVDHIERLFGTVSPMALTDIYHIMKNDPELFEGMNTILVMGGFANVNEKVEGKDETTNPYLDIKKKGKSK